MSKVIVVYQLILLSFSIGYLPMNLLLFLPPNNHFKTTTYHLTKY